MQVKDTIKLKIPFYIKKIEIIISYELLDIWNTSFDLIKYNNYGFFIFTY